MDIVDRATRSRMMASVGQKDTSLELALRRELHGLGLRYRLHVRELPGSPDLLFPSRRCAVFVHGCFWHAHDCKFASVPRTRVEFWQAKFASNKERDRRAVSELSSRGWRVMTVWGCALRSPDAVRAVALRVRRWLDKGPRVSVLPAESNSWCQHTVA